MLQQCSQSYGAGLTRISHPARLERSEPEGWEPGQLPGRCNPKQDWQEALRGCSPGLQARSPPPSTSGAGAGDGRGLGRVMGGAGAGDGRDQNRVGKAGCRGVPRARFWAPPTSRFSPSPPRTSCSHLFPLRRSLLLPSGALKRGLAKAEGRGCERGLVIPRGP